MGIEGDFPFEGRVLGAALDVDVGEVVAFDVEVDVDKGGFAVEHADVVGEGGLFDDADAGEVAAGPGGGGEDGSDDGEAGGEDGEAAVGEGTGVGC